MRRPVTVPGVAVRTRARRPAVVISTLFGLCLLVAFFTMGLGAVRVPQPQAIEALFGHGTVGQVRTIRDYELPRILMAFLIGTGLAVVGLRLPGRHAQPARGAGHHRSRQRRGARLGAPPAALPDRRAELSAAGGIRRRPRRDGHRLPRFLPQRRHDSRAAGARRHCRECVLRGDHPLRDDRQGARGRRGAGLAHGLARGDRHGPLLGVAARGSPSCVPLVGFYAHRLDLLQLGDDMAHGLGVAVERTRRLTLLFAVLLASACVAVAGSIVFIGLIAPHMARRLVGLRHAVLLPAAALIGTLMLLVADAIGRGVYPPDRASRRHGHGRDRSSILRLPPHSLALGETAMRLSASDLALHYDDVVVATDLSIELPDGQMSALIGPNGSGKSTLLRALARLLKPRAGEVILDGKAINSYSTKEVARRLAILPQVIISPEAITVQELVAYGRFRSAARSAACATRIVPRLTGRSESPARPSCATARSITSRTASASGPWIALVLAQGTDLILLDEPTTFLDIAYQLEVLELLKHLNEAEGKTIVIVLHDINLACEYSNDCSRCATEGWSRRATRERC